MEEAMTDKQAERVDILARLDELDRMLEIVQDPETVEAIKARKKELRSRL